LRNSLTIIPLCGVGTTCLSSCCDKDSAIIFYNQPPARRQSSLGIELVLTTTNVAGTNGLTCLPKHGGAGMINFGHPFNDRSKDRPRITPHKGKRGDLTQYRHDMVLGKPPHARRCCSIPVLFHSHIYNTTKT
jgi:hypothetical protein